MKLVGTFVRGRLIAMTQLTLTGASTCPKFSVHVELPLDALEAIG